MKRCEEKAEAREKKRLELQTQQHEDFKDLMSKIKFVIRKWIFVI
jgi:D-ribose pyranose/furanose isomerase RbsD